MNFLSNEIKYINFYYSDLYADFFTRIIKENFELGCYYRIIIMHNGSPLTKKGVPVDYILYKRRPDLDIEFSWLLSKVEEIVFNSDGTEEIYAEYNIDTTDKSITIPTNDRCDTMFTLAYFKGGM